MTDEIELNDGDALTTLPNGERVLYRDASHRYFRLIDGRQKNLTSVSSILSSIGGQKTRSLMGWAARQAEQGLDWRQVRDIAADRGTIVHAALQELAAYGHIRDLASFPREQRGYFQAAANFWLDARPAVLESEFMAASVEHGFAGRIDLLAGLAACELPVKVKDTIERREFSAGTAICDYKTGGIWDEAMLQLAAYKLAARESGFDPGNPPERLLAIALKDTGEYEVVESLATDEDFLAVLTMHRMLKKKLRVEHKAS